MKRTIITALLAIICITNMQAGKTKGKITLAGKPGHLYSVGLTNSSLSSNTKDKTFLTNSLGITANVFFPIIKSPSANFGFNVGGTYEMGGNGNPSSTLPSPYNVTGQTSSNVVYRGVDPRNPGFKTAFGPQANFLVGSRFVISPMVPVGYMSLTQKTLSAVQTTSYNGQNYEFNLATLPETKISGITVNPTMRLQYFVSKNIGFWVEGSYMTGPKVETQITKLIPNGAANQQGTYEIQALQNGTFVKGEIKTTSYNTTGFSVGLVFKLGKNKEDYSSTKRGPHGCQICGLFHANGMCSGSATSVKPTTSELHQLAEKTGDIKKGWNGTIKDLFEGNYADVVVSKNGGIDKIVNKINKKGKSTAKKITKNGKEYLAVSTQQGSTYNNALFEIENIGQASIISGGGNNCSGNCMTCSPVGGALGSASNCSCDETVQPNEFCNSSSSYASLSNHLNLLDTSLIPITLVDKDHLTATSINDIKNLLLAQMPHAEKIKSEFKKEDKTSYIETQFEDKGKGYVLISKLVLSGKKWIIKDKFLMMCAGSCNGTSYDCSLNGWGSVGVHTYCNCNSGCRFKIISFPDKSTDWSLDNSLEEIIDFKE